jgi:hypothetical protein
MKKLMEEIDTYGFECEAGPLFLCVPWMKLKAKILAMQDEPHGLPWAKRQQEDTTMDDTMCWNSDKEYPLFYHKCPECGATNANVHFAEAIQEKEDKTLITGGKDES